jgi:nicotinamidase-related amidase
MTAANLAFVFRLSSRGVRLCLVGLCASMLIAPAAARTIIDEWSEVKSPPAPALKPVKVDPKDTALLMLDFVTPLCGARPRCVAAVPKVAPLLAKSRDSGMLVVYTLAGQPITEVMPELAAKPGEPSVSSGPDKFMNTDLDKILKDKGIKTVIVGGTAAEGAVLNTAAAAALRGYKVIVPVDALASVAPYSEQYTVWHLGNSPRVGPQVTLTRLDQITF